MAEQKIHNLDEGVEESFTFQVLGHAYKFRHLNTEEIEQIKVLTDKGEGESKTYFYQFITKVSKTSPEFSKLSKKMLSPHWKKFLVMIKEEFGG